MKELLFTITKKDSGVKITHKASNARGECKTFKSQLQNKKMAIKKLISSKEFKTWHGIKTAELAIRTKNSVIEAIKEMLKLQHLSIEIHETSK